MCRTPVARVTTAATAGATYPKARRCPSAIPWPLVLTYSILVLYLIPMARKRQLWSTDLALVTSARLDDLIFSYFMSYSPYIPNLGSLPHSHGLEEAPAVHRPGPGHLVDIGQPHHGSFPVHKSHHAKFGVSLSSP